MIRGLNCRHTFCLVLSGRHWNCPLEKCPLLIVLQGYFDKALICTATIDPFRREMEPAVLGSAVHSRLCNRLLVQRGNAVVPKVGREAFAVRVRSCQEERPKLVLSPLQCAQMNAKFRVKHASQPNPQCLDRWAFGLLGNGHIFDPPEDVYERHMLATAFLDQQLLRWASMVNVDLKQGYQQVVLVGPGLDTRPFRSAAIPGLAKLMV
jgi:hypothetical protein